MFLTFETQTGGTANDTTSERMRITNIGNVGIGVTDPSEILHIIGNFRIETRPNETSSIDIKSDTGGFKIKYEYLKSTCFDFLKLVQFPVMGRKLKRNAIFASAYFISWCPVVL